MNGSKIIDLMTERGVSLRKVSREANVSPVTIYKIIRGEKVSTAPIEKLCLYFDVGIGDLVESGKGYDLKPTGYVIYPETIKKIQNVLDEVEEYTRSLAKKMDNIRDILDDDNKQLPSCTNNIKGKEGSNFERIKSLIDNVRQDIDTCVLKENAELN